MRLALALLLVVFAASPGNEGKNQPKLTDAHGRGSARQTTVAPIPPSVSPSRVIKAQPATQTKQDDATAKPQPFMSHAEWIMSILTFFYVTLTGVYVWYSRKTLKELHRQIGLIEKQDIATIRQLEISEKSAEAARQGVALQKAQMKQWVDFDDVQAKTPYFHSNTVETKLTVTATIENPTSHPLTLTSVLFTAGPTGEPPGVCSMQMAYTLAPQNLFHLSVYFPLKGESFTLYCRRELHLAIAIDIGFNDVFDKPQTQRFVLGGPCGQTNWSDFSLSQSTYAQKQSSTNE